MGKAHLAERRPTNKKKQKYSQAMGKNLQAQREPSVISTPAFECRFILCHRHR